MVNIIECVKCKAEIEIDKDDIAGKCEFCSEPYSLAEAQLQQDIVEHQAEQEKQKYGVSECHQCGAAMRFHVDLQAVGCNFCGNTIDLSKKTFISQLEADYVVSFKVQQNEFFEKALMHIANTAYVPLDIFEYIEFKETVGVFVPVYAYTGNFKADVTASIGHDRSETYTAIEEGKRVERSRTVTDWSPYNGHAKGTFRLLACGSSFLDEDEKVFLEGRNTPELFDYDEGLMLGFAEEPFRSDFDTEQLYVDRVKSSVNSIIDREVNSFLPGDRQKHVNWSADISKNTLAISYPIWHGTFIYDGEPYSIIGDGAEAAEIESKLPQDKKTKNFALYPFYAAGAGAVATVAAYLADTSPYFVNGMFWSCLFYLAFATLNRYVIISKGDKFRTAALESYRGQNEFDFDSESQNLNSGLGNPILLQAIGAGLTLVVFIFAFDPGYFIN